MNDKDNFVDFKKILNKIEFYKKIRDMFLF